MKDNQERAKGSFQLAYFPDFLHNEATQILEVAQRFAQAGWKAGVRTGRCCAKKSTW